MRRMQWIWYAILVTAGGVVCAEAEQDETIPANPVIGLVDGADLPEAVQTGIVEYVRLNLGVPLAFRTGSIEATGGLERAAETLRGQKQENEVLLIGFVRPPESEDLHLTLNTNARVAAINVTALADPDRQTLTWRLQRQVMRASAFLVGLSSSPDPHGVTRPYQSLEDLDGMGRNFSPPWRRQFLQRAAGKGLVREYSDLHGEAKGRTP